MSFLSQYGPIWRNELSHRSWQKRGKFDSLFNFTTIDCGPIISEDKIIKSNSTSHTGTIDSNCSKALTVKQRKCYRGGFPIVIEPCFWPLVKNPCNISIDSSNKHRNFLGSYQHNDVNHLVYVQKSLNEEFSLQVSEIYCPMKKTYQKLTLCDRRIISKFNNFNGIDCCVMGNKPCILVHCDGLVNFFSLTETSYNSHQIFNENPSRFCLNRKIENNFAMVDDDSEVKIFDVQTQNYFWGGKLDFYDQTAWTGIEFCQEHPLFLNLANENRVYQFDGRISCSSSHSIFSIDSMEKYIGAKEVINTFKCSTNYPFTYVICTNSLLLMDNRNCKQPVLTWQHMMKDHQAFPHIFKKRKDILLLAEPRTSKICFVPTEWSSTEHPEVTAVSAPKHFNVIKSSLKKTRENGIFFTNSISQYLQSFLIGLAHCGSTARSSDVLFLQNQFCDIFHLSLFEGKYAHNKQLPTEQVEKLKSFEEENIKIKKAITNFKSVKIKYIQKSDNQKRIKAIKGVTEERLHWTVYAKYNKKQTHNENLTNLFSTCEFNNLVNKALQQSPFSRNLLSVWGIKETNDSYVDQLKNTPKFIYKRLPFYIKDETKIPNCKMIPISEFYPEGVQRELPSELTTPASSLQKETHREMERSTNSKLSAVVKNSADVSISTKIREASLLSPSVKLVKLDQSLLSPLGKTKRETSQNSTIMNHKRRRSLKRKNISDGF